MVSKFKNARATNKSSAKAAPAASGAAAQLAEKISTIAAQLGDVPNAKQIMESAQQIWLAGLGAFSKAQVEGRKVFDTLVAQGSVVEEHTRHVAESAFETAKAQAAKGVEMATGKFDKLEQIFEGRVHSALNRLGVLTSKDVELLAAQVAELAESVHALLAAEKRAGGKATAPKAAAKTTAAPVVKAAVKTTAKVTKPVVKAVAKAATTVKKVAATKAKTVVKAASKTVKAA
jgi:poly(hydroxyalkanoate) granule-associated protein